MRRFFWPFATEPIRLSPHAQLPSVTSLPCRSLNLPSATHMNFSNWRLHYQPGSLLLQPSLTQLHPAGSSCSDATGHPSPSTWNCLDLASTQFLKQQLTVPWHFSLQVLVKPATAFVKRISVILCNLSPFLPLEILKQVRLGKNKSSQ